MAIYFTISIGWPVPSDMLSLCIGWPRVWVSQAASLGPKQQESFTSDADEPALLVQVTVGGTTYPPLNIYASTDPSLAPIWEISFAGTTYPPVAHKVGTLAVDPAGCTRIGSNPCTPP